MPPSPNPLSPLRLARLQSISPKAVDGIQGAFVARVLREDAKRVTVYAKRLSDRATMAELACAVLGRALNLPIPEPLLVYIPAAFGGPAFAMGSTAVNAPHLAAAIAANDPTVLARLALWKGLAPAACFDEWIANHDRNQQNLLFDGVDFHLIDHEQAADPRRLSADALLPQNGLMALAKAHAKQLDLLKITVLGVMQVFQDHVLAQTAAALASAEPVYNSSAVLTYLGERQVHLQALGSQRIPLPQAGLFDRKSP